MPILVGFHVEGHDHFILRANLAGLLQIAETDIDVDCVAAPGGGRGREFVVKTLPRALRRFYAKCANAAVVGIDNDGVRDLTADGINEDPRHPRHWLHDERASSDCSRCRVQRIVTSIRPKLHWIEKKPGATWPVVIAVPVEAIEAWLLTTREILKQNPGPMLRAEDLPKTTLKHQLYGADVATAEDVEDVALPLVRELNPVQVQRLAECSKSFAQFAQQVSDQRRAILASEGCW